VSTQSNAGVIGAGTMGVGIAYVFAAAGFSIVVAEPDAERREALERVMTKQAGRAVERGALTAPAAEALRARVRCVPTIDDLPEDLEVLVESVPERLQLKLAVLEQASARRPVLLATNTSSLSIDALAMATDRPDAFVGMHFFNPVWSLELVEVIRGEASSQKSVSRACELAGALGKTAIVVANVPGFATSRLDFAAALEAMRMLEDGVASAEDIDRAATLAYRHPVGPLRLSDIVGLDVRLDIAEHLAGEYGERFAPPAILRAKVAAGKLGRKSGRGFFDWT
jgi:3-hydroxybutyryl-CoA dehydrogenase